MLKSAAVALAFIASISTASAQMLCMSLDDVKKMTKGSGEEPQVAGSLEEGWNFLLFASPKGGDLDRCHGSPQRARLRSGRGQETGSYLANRAGR